MTRPKKKTSKYRSQLEEKVADLLLNLDVTFEYEKTRFSYTIPHNYTPDFILPNGVILECKGYWDGEDRRKIKSVKEQNPDIEEYDSSGIPSLGFNGGDVPVEMTKEVVDKLEEAIHLQSDLLNLKANPDRKARGSVIESKLEKGRGSVATVLVQKGTLKVSDIFVSGSEWGKVKALIDDKGKNIKQAEPSVPVEVLGFDSNPLAGDDFIVVENEGIARKIAEFRSSKLQIQKNTVAKSNVEEMFAQINKGEATSLPVVIKTDVQGSAEAIENSITKLSTDEVKVNVIYKGVGAITESDVTLAASGKGFIVGFNVRALPHARDIAKRDGVDIKYYSIIYELIDDVKNLLTGLLKPDISENITGNVEIREVFNISKVGNIAGCMVKDGLISRKSQIRILRDNIVIHKGQISSLKRFKEEVSEVKSGFECGVMLDNYSDIKVGDIIETFEEVSTSRKL